MRVSRRRRIAASCALAVGGSLGTFLLMAHDGRVRLGVPLGAAAVLAATCGVLGLVRGDAAEDTTAAPPAVEESTRDAQARRTIIVSVANAIGAIAFFVASVALAARGVLGPVSAGILVTAGWIAFVVAAFRAGEAFGAWSVDETGAPRPLLRRHGFWLLAGMGVLYLPWLGAGSLWDPWESHYAEVAREILSRDDWISLWWGHEGWFFSKPVLELWAQAIAMASLGVHYEPGRVLEGARGVLAHPEWAVRLPNVLFAMGGLYLLYKGGAAAFGRRAALVGAVAVATSSQWFMLAHQATCDMPFVGAMAGGVGLVLLALHTDGTARAREYEIALGRMTVHVSAWHLVLGAVVVVVLPQVLYLVTRNVELVLHATGPHGFRLHADEVFAGSVGNCGLPGDPACGDRPPARHLAPVLQALVWAGCLAAILVLEHDERRLKRLYYLGAWVLLALATMAKGPAALAIPAVAVAGALLATRAWREVFEMELLAGSLVVIAMVLPWFVAVFVRHGTAFTDELIFHDMVSRAFDHVHDTNAGTDTGVHYYIWQLGYALFPWTPLVPLGLAAGLSAPEGPRPAAHTLLVLWALGAFALFSIMGTKFHHYIFPALPPLAMLAGVAVDSLALGPGERREREGKGLVAGALSLGGALVGAFVAWDLGRRAGGGTSPGAIHLLQLFTYRYDRAWPGSVDLHAAVAAAGGAAVALAALFALPRLRRAAALGLGVLACAFTAWGLAVYLPRLAPHWGQRDIIAAYYRSRAGAEEPLVAYQLNWKGENFYSGNRIAIFVSSGAPFATWLGEERRRGTHVVYVVTEQGRVASLEAELHARSVHPLTDRETSNQFVLVRAEL